MAYANKKEFKDLYSHALALRDTFIDFGIGLHSPERGDRMAELHRETILVDREKISKNKDKLETASLLKDAKQYSGQAIAEYLRRYFTSLVRIYQRVYNETKELPEQQKLVKMHRTLCEVRRKLLSMDYSCSELIVVTIRRPTSTHNPRHTTFTDIYYFISN